MNIIMISLGALELLIAAFYLLGKKDICKGVWWIGISIITFTGIR
jgi:hypothetical protein